jgi:hypothetical protein
MSKYATEKKLPDRVERIPESCFRVQIFGKQADFTILTEQAVVVIYPGKGQEFCHHNEIKKTAVFERLFFAR